MEGEFRVIHKKIPSFATCENRAERRKLRRQNLNKTKGNVCHGNERIVDFEANKLEDEARKEISSPKIEFPMVEFDLSNSPSSFMERNIAEMLEGLLNEESVNEETVSVSNANPGTRKPLIINEDREASVNTLGELLQAFTLQDFRLSGSLDSSRRAPPIIEYSPALDLLLHAKNPVKEPRLWDIVLNIREVRAQVSSIEILNNIVHISGCLICDPTRRYAVCDKCLEGTPANWRATYIHCIARTERIAGVICPLCKRDMLLITDIANCEECLFYFFPNQKDIIRGEFYRSASP